MKSTIKPVLGGLQKRWPFNTGDCLIEVTA